LIVAAGLVVGSRPGGSAERVIVRVPPEVGFCASAFSTKTTPRLNVKTIKIVPGQIEILLLI
jgi:hypothetical protein